MEVTKQKLLEVEKSFKEQVETSTNRDYVLRRYDAYYKYLLKVELESQSEEIETLSFRQRLNLIYRLIQFLDRFNLIAKDHSKKWNKKLIARVGNYCEDFKEHKAKENLNDEDLKEKGRFVLQDLKNETDSMTASYCWSMLQMTIGYGFIPSLISTNDDSINPNKDGTMKYVLRPGVGGRKIKDKGERYWHPDAKELITYDECTERGLGHHLLAYPKGHSLQNLSVGFDETDPSRIQKTFDNETKEFIETAFITEETPTD